MFGFFSFLFKKRPPADPPTEKQLRYAKLLGIDVPPTMTKRELSAAIGQTPTPAQRRYAARIGIKVSPKMTRRELGDAIEDAERRDPKLAKRREEVNRKIREKEYGKELVDEEDRWDRFIKETGYMLAVYKHGKEIIVDVLHVYLAYIDDHDKLRLGVEAPRVLKERYLRGTLFWDRDFELPIASLLYHEPLQANFDMNGKEAYLKTVKRGLKIARKRYS